jgi:uncharacterized protein (TIGR02678 family)
VIADGVRTTDLAAYQRAVRTLLVTPLVTTTYPDPGALRTVRRFLAPLRADLGDLAGYRIEVTPSCARLVRRIDRPDPTQVVRRRDRTPLDRRRYAYLCLVLAELQRPSSQVALTELAERLRRRAADIEGLSFDPDTYRHRLAFADAVRVLLEFGALREVEVSTADWLRDPDAGEALYDLDRDVVHAIVRMPAVLQHTDTAAGLLADAGPGAASTRDGRRAATRQRLVRLLLEHPVVYLDDLTDAERTYLTSQGRALAADLQRLTGAQLERRAEGLALIDTVGGFSDRRFPTGGTANQVALLLADRIVAAVRDGRFEEHATAANSATHSAEVLLRLDDARPLETPREVSTPPSDGVAGEPAATVDPDATATPGDLGVVTGPLVPDAWLRAQVEQLTEHHGKTFSSDLRDDPAALLRAALEVLATFDLVRPAVGGIVPLPALARFRDVTVTVAAAQPSLLLDDGGEDRTTDDRDDADDGEGAP